MLAEHLSQPLCDTTMGLPVDHRFMNDGSHVIDRRVADHRDNAGLRVDLDLADVATIRERHLWRVEFAYGIEAPPKLFRKVVRLSRALRQIEDGNSKIGPRHRECAVGKLHIADRDLEQMRCDPAALLDRAITGDRRRATGHHQ
jgi:hypothetical protein